MTAPKDARSIPNYTYLAAAKIVGVTANALRRWQQVWSDDLQEGAWKTSYYDLASSFVVMVLRKRGFSMQQIRMAYRVGQEYCSVDNVFLHRWLRHDGRTLMLRRPDKDHAVTLDRRVQIESVPLIDPYLQRVWFDDVGWAEGLSPILDNELRCDEVVVSPRIGYGLPALKRSGINTSTLASYYMAGDSKQDIMDNFGITGKELDQAILFEYRNTSDLPNRREYWPG